MSNQGEPLLQPVTVTHEHAVYNRQPITPHEKDVAGEGCCHFSNNFYLTAAFGLVFSIICVFQTFFFLVFGYILPTCFCGDFWIHLLSLSTNVKLIYFTVFLYLAAFTILGFICLRGLMMEEKRKIIPFMVILIVTQVSIVIGGIVGAIKGGQAFEEAMANQTKDDIFEMLGMVFKEKFVKFIETAIELQEIVLTDDALNIDALLEAIFHPQVLVQADAVKQMMIFTSVMVGLGMNLIIIGSIFLLFKVIQRMNKFEQYIEEQPQVYASSPQYLQPDNKDYQYYPTNQNYTQHPANGTLSKRSQRSRQSEENLLLNNEADYHPSGIVQ